MDSVKKLLCVVVSLSLSFSLAACAGESSSAEPEPEKPGTSFAEEIIDTPGDTLHESNTEYQTYQIEPFGIEFDCPSDFGSDIKSTVISKNEAHFSVGAEDRVIFVSCSRIASLDEWAAIAAATGKDSSALYEGFESLNVTDAITSWKTGYEAFELLDSFSGPDSYGFYYIGTDSIGDAPASELGYRYKNYGSFVDDGGIINVVLSISAPEAVDQEGFISLCEAVTNSLRLSDRDAEDSMSSAEIGGDFESVLEPLTGSAYEEQCVEIVDTFFHYAPLVCYDEPRLYLEKLLGGNKELFRSLEYEDGLLEGEDNFDSELTIRDCGKCVGTVNEYCIDVEEIRTYYRVEPDIVEVKEYAHSIYMTINSPTDYCITGVTSQYIGPVDDGQWESSSSGESGGTDSISASSQPIWINDPEAQRTYGANAQIDDHVFSNVSGWIWSGDYQLSNYNPGSAQYTYSDACSLLEERGYTDTPLYYLALQRLALAYDRIEEMEEARRNGINPYELNWDWP